MLVVGVVDVVGVVLVVGVVDVVSLVGRFHDSGGVVPLEVCFDPRARMRKARLSVP